MIVYGSSLSPFVRKVLVFAAEKGIEVESRGNRGPGGFDPDFLAASPFQKIPAMKDGDFELCDSSAIVTYMERLKPDPQLMPSDAKLAAKVVWFEEFADTIFCAAGIPIFFNRIVAPMLGRPCDTAAADRAETEALPPALDYIEKIAPAPGAFLVGDSLTLADIAVASPFANLRHLAIDVRSTHPRAAAWAEAVQARPSFSSLFAGEVAFLNQHA